MSWMDDHYRMDNEGNFETLEDYNRAVKNGDLEELSNGRYYDSSCAGCIINLNAL